MPAEPARRIAVLARHNALLRLRDPAAPLVYLAMPMMMMYVLRPLYGAALPEHGDVQAVVGMLVLFSTLSISIVGSSMLVERTWHTWERLRATPASTAELLLGKAVPVFVLLIAQQALLLGFAGAVLGLPMVRVLPMLVIAVLCWSFALLALGSLLAALVRSHGELSVVSDIGGFAFSILGGALLPVALMPPWAQYAAPFSPGYWAVAMMHSALAGDAAGTLTPAAVLGAVGLLAGALACLRLRTSLGTLRG